MKTHCMRLTRGQDLLVEIEKYVNEYDIKAGTVLSCVGCVSCAVIRDATGERIQTVNEDMELISLNGTVSKNRIHLHISLSKKDLSVIGGHLKTGTVINTTCELIILELEDMEFNDLYDEKTGYNELEIRKYIKDKFMKI
ncbi:MAG: PPC domain-containing DNA-binding protein [Clostridia bacterium]